MIIMRYDDTTGRYHCDEKVESYLGVLDNAVLLLLPAHFCVKKHVT